MARGATGGVSRATRAHRAEGRGLHAPARPRRPDRRAADDTRQARAPEAARHPADHPPRRTNVARRRPGDHGSRMRQTRRGGAPRGGPARARGDAVVGGPGGDCSVRARERRSPRRRIECATGRLRRRTAARVAGVRGADVRASSIGATGTAARGDGDGAVTAGRPPARWARGFTWNTPARALSEGATGDAASPQIRLRGPTARSDRAIRRSGRGTSAARRMPRTPSAADDEWRTVNGGRERPTCDRGPGAFRSRRVIRAQEGGVRAAAGSSRRASAPAAAVVGAGARRPLPVGTARVARVRSPLPRAGAPRAITRTRPARAPDPAPPASSRAPFRPGRQRTVGGATCADGTRRFHGKHRAQSSDGGGPGGRADAPRRRN